MPLLFSEFATQLQGRSGVAYGALLPTPHAPPFHDWMVDHRYVSDAQLADETLERWMWAAIAISKLLAVAIDNGEAQ
jgi:hypothetical protein